MRERIVVRKHERINYSKNTFYTLLHTHHDKDNYIDYHWHNSIEITYVVKGLKVQCMEDEKIIAPTGTLLLVNSGVIHDIDVKNGLEGIVLLIDRDYIDSICPKCKDHGFSLKTNLDASKEIIDYLFKLVTAHEKNNLLDAHIIVLKIIKILAEKLIVDGFYIKEKHDDESYELVISIIKYINQHYQQKITLDKLALITNYNKSYLSNIFKKKTGITIFEYLRNVRLEHCLSDLKYKNNTIVEIALNNGFANIQIFNRIFKEIYKITPKQYRKNNI
ncbi:MAG: helix-turn-helix transcriptional regulator [[Clostridium] spiroforme]|uniref:Helix-turn-helix transcriptional regulator n=1 Tax=Thomasclavelia spiroformis TaxID=29348 RepID=A0A943ELL4_9FIRM|nr:MULTISPECIES: AraC family transcriptional regulator [Thomasclavelia]MBS5588646.1 helix-turn-helix transcriptional regulator [Thomasclavelia spiroformis]